MSLGYVPRERGDGMMRMSKVEAQALAAFIGRIRPDWHQAGIVAAIEKAAPLGSAAAVGAALCKLAENYDLRTPALLADPGPHWHGTTVASRQPPSMCPEPGHEQWRALDCNHRGPCFTASQDIDHESHAQAVLAEHRRALAESERRPRPKPPARPVSDVAAAREAIDQNTPTDPSPAGPTGRTEP